MRKFLAATLALLLGAPAARATNLPTLANDTTVDCTLSGTGTCIVLTNGAGTVSFNLSSSGASGLTYNFQGSSDGSHWFTVPYADPSSNPATFSYTTSSATSGQWIVAAGSLQKIQFNLTAYSAGTLTVHGEAGAGSSVVYTIGGSVSGSFTCAACALETGGNLALLKADGDTIAGAVSSSKMNTRNYFSTNNADAQPHVCGSYKYVHITSATDTQIVAASGSTTVFVCDFDFSVGSTPTIFYLEKGTSGTCGGLTQIGIVHNGSANMTAKASNAFYRGLNTGASNQLCVNTNAAGPLDIGVFYDQY